MARVKYGRVRAGEPPISRTLTFSFKHLDLSHPKFKPEYCTLDFWNSFLCALKDLSDNTVEDFCDINHTEHRHLIVFEDTCEPAGFGIDSTDNDLWMNPWQFALEPDSRTPPNSLWRVHGVIISDTFYVIWLDPDHCLYPR